MEAGTGQDENLRTANDDQLDKSPIDSTSVRPAADDGSSSAVPDVIANSDPVATAADTAYVADNDQAKENGDDQEEMVVEAGEDAVIY